MLHVCMWQGHQVKACSKARRVTPSHIEGSDCLALGWHKTNSLSMGHWALQTCRQMHAAARKRCTTPYLARSSGTVHHPMLRFMLHPIRNQFIICLRNTAPEAARFGACCSTGCSTPSAAPGRDLLHPEMTGVGCFFVVDLQSASKGPLIVTVLS